jgi:RNA binding exosome subunit
MYLPSSYDAWRSKTSSKFQVQVSFWSPLRSLTGEQKRKERSETLQKKTDENSWYLGSQKQNQSQNQFRVADVGPTIFYVFL